MALKRSEKEEGRWGRGQDGQWILWLLPSGTFAKIPTKSLVLVLITLIHNKLEVGLLDLG